MPNPALVWPALDSLDMAPLISPDGRDTPLLPSTPVILGDPTAASSSTPAPNTPAPASGSGVVGTLESMVVPDHLGARLAVGAIAILAIAIVLWRIVSPSPAALA